MVQLLQERNSIELLIVRVVEAVELPVDESVINVGPAPYVWITTATNATKRGTRKVTVAPSKDTGGFFAALKKAAGAVGIGPAGSSHHKILNEAFTEIGNSATYVWDEEFTLMVDKVGQRLLHAEAVDDRLRQGKDSLGTLLTPSLCVRLWVLLFVMHMQSRVSTVLLTSVTIGRVSIPIESLPLGKVERNSEGLLYRCVGEQSLQWFEV